MNTAPLSLSIGKCHKLTGISVGVSSPAVFASEQFKGDDVVRSSDPITTIGWVSIGIGDSETLQICLASPALAAVPIEYMILNVSTPVCRGCLPPASMPGR